MGNEVTEGEREKIVAKREGRGVGSTHSWLQFPHWWLQSHPLPACSLQYITPETKWPSTEISVVHLCLLCRTVQGDLRSIHAESPFYIYFPEKLPHLCPSYCKLLCWSFLWGMNFKVPLPMCSGDKMRWANAIQWNLGSRTPRELTFRLLNK